jgi:hypothetical protein
MQISLRTALIALRYLERSIPKGAVEEQELAETIKKLRELTDKPRKG